jgi:hypothetical protein
MALSLIGQIVLGYTIVLNDTLLGKEYYNRTAICALIIAISELGSHFDISRSPCISDARGAILYRYVALNMIGFIASILIFVTQLVRSSLLEILLTFFSLSLRPHALSINTKTEEVFWRDEAIINLFGALTIVVNSNPRISVGFFLAIKSIFYVVCSLKIIPQDIFSHNWIKDITHYLKTRGVGGSIERGYFNLSWPSIPILINKTEISDFARVWPTLERLCAGIVSVVPIYLNSSPKHIWKQSLLARNIFGVGIITTILITRSETVTWVLLVVYIATTDALLLSAMLYKANFKSNIFRLSSVALLLMYLFTYWRPEIFLPALLVYCVVNECFFLALRPLR